MHIQNVRGYLTAHAPSLTSDRDGTRESAVSDPFQKPRMATRLPGLAAAAAIMVSLLVMIGAGLLRSSWMPPTALPMPVPGPPWELAVHLSIKIVVWALWAAALLGAGGVVAGLMAARRGMPVPVRTLLVAAAVGVVALTLLPPVGSTDALDYAVYGHIAALGHSPYVLTPAWFRQLTHLAGIPSDWQHDPSVYGPLATLEQLAAAKLGGLSLARTVFWLKLWNAIGFGAIAVAVDWMWRGNRAARLRAHLLWTANPLVIWSGIASAHLDVVAAAIGLAGLLIVDRRVIGRPVLAALVAGVCVGASADIKAAFALYGLGIAWCLRRRPGQLLAAAAGALAVLVPSYIWTGLPALKALAARTQTGLGYGFYKFFLHRMGFSPGDAVPIAAILFVPVAWLALRGLPEGWQGGQAVRAALGLSLAWLLVWPHQFAWYSLMAVCVLAFYRSSRLDWLALGWLSTMTIADIPGLGPGQDKRLGHIIAIIQYNLLDRIAPLVMLATLVTFVVWCITRRWDALADAQPTEVQAPAGEPAVHGSPPRLHGLHQGYRPPPRQPRDPVRPAERRR